MGIILNPITMLDSFTRSFKRQTHYKSNIA
jgi:hypothetical protein